VSPRGRNGDKKGVRDLQEDSPPCPLQKRGCPWLKSPGNKGAHRGRGTDGKSFFWIARKKRLGPKGGGDREKILLADSKDKVERKKGRGGWLY